MKIIAIATMLIISTSAFAAPATPTNKESDASQDTRPAPDSLLKRNQDPSGNRIPLPTRKQDPYDGQRPLQSVPAPAGKAGPQIG